MIFRVLFIWILAVACLVSWWLVRGEAASSPSADQPFLAEGLPVDRITDVEINFRDGESITLQRTGNQWQQLEPFPVGVDAYTARQLATTATTLRGLKGFSLDDPADPRRARLGLETPPATITWRWDEGSLTLKLGNVTMGGRAWVALEDGAYAWLVDSSLHARLFEIDPRLWRDGALLPDAGVETRVVAIEAGGQQLLLEKQPTGWVMLAPVATRADAASIEDWLARLSRARALGYLYDQPDDLARFGLEPPVATIQLQGRLKDDRTVLLLGDPIGVGSSDRYALVEGSPTILRLGEDVQRVLVPSTGMLVDPTGTAVVREDVARLEIRHPSGVGDFSLAREFDGWLLTPDGGTSRPVSRAAAAGLLGQLTEARASEISFSDYPVELEQAVVVLYGFDGSPLDAIRIIREENGGRWALENGDNVLRIFSVEFSPQIDASQYGPA
ncbi:MAG: hypothetical protein CBC35_08465 [Planctomycetes bacterium TMED75]|nr:hypothetical protein [Planctomycetaceae bacterium]OUU91867.1 MAG: hypothetical protein CBC35_08465 [Planctomycetes bacterium TMED75]